MMGKRKPALRFKGFEGEWETCRLGDNSDIITGGTPNTKVIEFWHPKEIPWLSSGEVNKKRINFTENMISQSGLSNSSANWVKKNSVLIALAGQGKTRGTVAITNIPLTTNQSVAAVIPNDVLNPEFIFQNLESRYDELRTNSSGDRTRGGLNKRIIFETSISAPKIEEQTKIGNLFKHLDALITQQQRKYESLQNVKKSMLEKMFPKDGADVPEIRFKGFSGAWHMYKLDDIAERVTRKNTNLESTLPLTISAQYGLVDQITYFNNRVASADVTNYYLVKKGEFAYNKSSSDGFPFGTVKRLERYEMGVLSTLYIIFNPKNNNVNPDYLVSYYDTNNWHKDISERATIGARNHGLLNISADDFFDTKVKIPNSLEEQTKIGNFFKHLDTLLTQHQKKLDHLKHLKSALLEKMFVSEAA